jgi:hypothetical protein
MPAAKLKIVRPKPPKILLKSFEDLFIPAPEILTFTREAFLNPSSKLYNEDHGHLLNADIGFLWTNVPYKRQMNPVAGMAQIPRPSPTLDAWTKARYWQQLREWFGTDKLDFLITLYAKYADECDDASFCALDEHELYHCGQAEDEFGFPKFRRSSGLPVYGIRGHDAEEFVGIVERYGPGAGAGKTAELIAAGKRKPKIALADIKSICGTC